MNLKWAGSAVVTVLLVATGAHCVPPQAEGVLVAGPYLRAPAAVEPKHGPHAEMLGFVQPVRDAVVAFTTATVRSSRVTVIGA